MARKAIDLKGRRFGRLVVRERTPGGRCIAVCDCGKTHDARVTHILAGKIRSCGCLNGDRRRSRVKHGEFSGGKTTAEYRAWNAIKARCHRPTCPSYHRYGERGIAVADEWRFDFLRFLADMGRRPTRQHSIERIDNDKGYEPGNCKWATADEQAKNKTSTIRVDVDGESLCLKDACSRLGISYKAVHLRVSRYGWSLEEALRVPVREWGPGKRRKAA